MLKDLFFKKFLFLLFFLRILKNGALKFQGCGKSGVSYGCCHGNQMMYMCICTFKHLFSHELVLNSIYSSKMMFDTVPAKSIFCQIASFFSFSFFRQIDRDDVKISAKLPASIYFSPNDCFDTLPATIFDKLKGSRLVLAHRLNSRQTGAGVIPWRRR